MSAPFIQELRLENFKCYESLTLKFSKGVNVLYGLNGSGKTSIMEGLAIACGCFLSEFRVRNILGGDIKNDQVRLATLEGMREPEFQFPCRISALGTVLNREVRWGREKLDTETSMRRIEDDAMGPISQDGSAIASNGRREKLPIICFFSTRRLFVPRDSEMPHPGRSKGYFNSISGENTQSQIRNWLKDAEFDQYQRRQDSPGYADEGLKGIYNVVLGNLFDGEWSRIFYNEPQNLSHKGLFLVSTRDRSNILPETALSDGYRNLLWLFLEIAWRCYMLNPYLGENAAKETNGIVMIDEIDLHLHPAWQQKVLGQLTKAFPNIQFVITTHSPIVLGSVKQGQVILLEGQTARVVPAPYGLTPSYILESYMGISERLPELREDIQRYFELINQGAGTGEEARTIRSRLESVMSPDDPIFGEADSLLYYIA